MSELSPGDDWYVAVNGVPVGPIRIAEVRRKAALGAVTEDSLVWQEGLDEWRPLRTFPELAVMVREAVLSGRSITPPPAEARPSLAPPPRTGGSMRPVAAAPVGPARIASQRPNPLVAPAAARSNVVPITSRLATAEKLDEPTQVAPMPRPSPFVAPAPAVAPAAQAMAAAVPAAAFVAAEPVVASAATSTTGAVVPRQSSGPPWIVIGMLLLCIAFGAVSAFLLFGPRPQATPTAPVAQVHDSPSATASAAAVLPPASAQPADSAAPAASAAGTVATKGPIGQGGARSAIAAPAATPSNTGRSLDLHGLSGNTVTPTEEMGSEGPKAAGQCFTEGQVAQVIGQHQVAIRRACWERNSSSKSSVNVSVSLTIGPDGSAQGVSASGDDPAVAHCIENDVRNWRFPNMGCSQKIAVPFKFVRQ
jgi:hypothetical protein